MDIESFSVIFLAGGVGKRMGAAMPKQYLLLNGKPIAAYSFELFTSMPEVNEIIVVCKEEHQKLFQSLRKGRNLYFAKPGELRQDSVLNGLQLLQGNPLVCIHDSARPFIDASMIRKVVDMAAKWDAAVLGVKARSTIKLCDREDMVINTPDRSFLWEIQSPQVIRLNLLKEGFAHAREQHLTVTDDVSLVELLGKPVKVVQGSYSNIKITTPEDLIFAKHLLEEHVLL